MHPSRRFPIDAGRRAVLALGLTLAGWPGLSTAAAQGGFPERPMQLIIGLPPGGPSDQLARAVAASMSRTLGQPVTVENKPGADGAIAVRAALSAPRDGHALLFTVGSMIAIPLTQKQAGFDLRRDFAPVGTIGRLTFGAFVAGDVPARTAAELVALAKARPDGLSYAASNLSETMAASAFMTATGTTMTRVAYKGSTQAIPDVVANRVQVTFTPLAAGLGHAREGRLRLLGVLLPARLPGQPDLPTLQETGGPAVSVPAWQGVLAPAGLPAEALAKVAQAVAQAARSPEVAALAERLNLRLEALDGAAMGTMMAQDYAGWERLAAEGLIGRD